MTARKRRPRICLAASGGGHVRQILDLKPFWQEHDHYLVTEPTALGHSLATDYPTRFVDHFAFGHARLASRATLAASGLLNFWASLRPPLRELPAFVIPTSIRHRLLLGQYVSFCLVFVGYRFIL